MNTPARIKVWDLFVRLFHWGLVLAFTFAFASEDDLLGPHTWAGYIVLSLLLLRIVWGFIGTSYVRFSNFVFTPQTIIGYLKDTMAFKAKRYVGHNPAGGAMIIVLLVSLLLTAMSGVILFGLEGEGLLATWRSLSSELVLNFLEGVHEFFANFTVFLVIIPVAGVVFESLVHGENLVDAMINGKKLANTTIEPNKEGQNEVHFNVINK